MILKHFWSTLKTPPLTWKLADSSEQIKKSSRKRQGNGCNYTQTGSSEEDKIVNGEELRKEVK